MDTARLILGLGAAAGLLGVAMGAFGAHALRATLGPQALAVYQTAVQYHLVHALGAVLAALAAALAPESPWPRLAGALMLLGVVLFSGGLYAFALGGQRAFAALAPFGGAAFLLGWLALAATALRGW